ncbi:MAG: hypothetical protein CL943_03845 [Candidatus Diapherotrites archaeon]|uniref:Rubrerythrin diiron-binding domain-containing protein n=1 Tax=Candidatus Iainarchaeum sp. TaxID=3101447 RepID=A0A2D6M1Y3_9ARCH|nr:hypothetical protein [Candidatus Diapherotrites archaeon]|tara:strand:+ start:563 stop:1096 length:534 start_codon:yes stop_codon:yes gene_type:complete
MDDTIITRFTDIPKAYSTEISTAIAIGKEIETRARDFYARNAERTEEKELKTAFEFLASQEQKHFEILDTVAQKLQEDGRFAVINKEDLRGPAPPKIYPNKKENIDEFGEKNELTILLWAMRAEKKAELFYRTQANKAELDEAKEFFNNLADFEAEHFEFLDALFSAWTSTDDFILG